MNIDIHPVAVVRSPFKQKFAIPRQPNLVPEAIGELVFNEPFKDINLFRGLEGFSHLWLVFAFHATAEQGWSPTVQPPRLGGKQRVGVFASRSPFRPNPVGISVVRNLGVHQNADSELILRVGGIDVLDNTPVIDIKPYVPYADSLPDADAGFADSLPGHARDIKINEKAEQQLEALESDYPDLKGLIQGVLSQDPRPAWRVNKADDKQYGMTLYDVNIKWRIDDQSVHVVDVTRMAEPDF